MTEGPLRVLFLCTGNSARSQMAEALLRDLSRGRIDVHSAGTAPQTDVHPVARQVLKEKHRIETDGLTPKSLDRFLDQRFDVVITVCDEAAETCPTFPNADQRIHWNLEDPAKVPAGPEQRRMFEDTANRLVARLRLWLSLPDVARRMATPSS